ncbi:hypothetical protein [Gelatiniphilus marinus]|uniref:Lipoprotein n=1 Tax=Gelatiniphilus marinus TaxID=1759464 RepID=A0ABW5JV80_9FLAO
MKRKILLFIGIVILIATVRNCFSDDKNNADNKKTETQNNTFEKEIRTEKTDTIIVQFTKSKDRILAMKELAYFENKLQNSFWTEFQQTNKYGRKYGPKEIEFSQNKFENFAQKLGFTETKNGTLMDYDGMKNGFHIYLDNNGAVPSSSGWVQKWKIKVQKEKSDTIYKLEKDIILNPR